MTINESLKNWLYGFDNIEVDDRVNTDKLDGEAESYGLFKQATQEVTPFIDGSRDVTAYFYFLARQSAKSEKARLSNIAWMEQLERWVFEKNRKRELPELDGPRSCNRVTISVGAYMSESENSETAQYQLSISINYTEV